MKLIMDASSRQQGVALVLVLWLLSLLTIMAGSFALSMRRQTALIDHMKSTARASAQAEAGIAIAQTMLLAVDQTRIWRTDGSIYRIHYPDQESGEEAEIRIRLIAEAGKIDINTASQEVLQSLLAHAPHEGEDEDEKKTKVVGAIIDWRDEDDLVNIEGAEEKDYHAAGLKYKPRNARFRSIEELQMVLGMTPALYQWLEPLVTIDSGLQQVDVSRAPPEVLQVLPTMDAAGLQSVLTARQQQNQMQTFGSASSDEGEITPGAERVAAATINGAVTIVAEAVLVDGATAIVSTMLKRAPSASALPFQAIKWQRNPSGYPSLFSEDMNQWIVADYAESELDR
jgi:general secretion pathway protein K